MLFMIGFTYSVLPTNTVARLQEARFLQDAILSFIEQAYVIEFDF